MEKSMKANQNVWEGFKIEDKEWKISVLSTALSSSFILIA